MKKQKKRKNTLPEEDTSKVVASSVDPSLLVRVHNDHRINVENVLDHKMKLVVAEWGQNISPPPDVGSNVLPVGDGSSPSTGVGLVAPQNGDVPALAPDNVDGSHGADGILAQVVSAKSTVTPVSRPNVEDGSLSVGSQVVPIAGQVLVFKAGGSGGSSVRKTVASIVRKHMAAGLVKQRAKQPQPRNSGNTHGIDPAFNRAIPPTPLPNRPEVAVPGAVPAGSPEGVKVRPQFSEILKDNRIVGNGLKLQQYDPMENDDDVVLDASDEFLLPKHGDIV
ncbi:hypothetical protein LIER_07381 [Lithospermum erythrorhizon]|uniref:Uncharacterized protein n=1 Tax=Lithospermum erythrorhizon TaxID=34254 RepID=A0AAV3P905_LITER